MNIGEVYQVKAHIQGIRIDETLSPGDIVEVFSVNRSKGVLTLGIYSYSMLYDFYMVDIKLSDFMLVSPHPLPKNHPLRQPAPVIQGVPPVYPALNLPPNPAPPLPGNIIRPSQIAPMALLPYGISTVEERVQAETAHVASLKCECGCSSVGVSNHSDYCPLYEKSQS